MKNVVLKFVWRGERVNFVMEGRYMPSSPVSMILGWVIFSIYGFARSIQGVFLMRGTRFKEIPSSSMNYDYFSVVCNNISILFYKNRRNELKDS